MPKSIRIKQMFWKKEITFQFYFYNMYRLHDSYFVNSVYFEIFVYFIFFVTCILIYLLINIFGFCIFITIYQESLYRGYTYVQFTIFLTYTYICIP